MADCKRSHFVIKDRRRHIAIKERRRTHIHLGNASLLKSQPQPPQNLTVSTIGETTVDLDWDDLATSFDDYTVHVQNTSTGTQEQEITGISLSDATVMGLATGDDYEFWVVSVRDSIESKESNHVTATPADTSAPSAPTGLTATAGDTVVDLNWDDNTETDLAGYNVYVDGVKENNSLIASSDYQVIGLNNGQSYNFHVTAVDDASNESNASSTVSATPFAPASGSHLVLNGTDQYVNLGQLGTFGSQMDLMTIELKFENSITDVQHFYGAYQNSVAGGNEFGQQLIIRLNWPSVGDIQVVLRGDDSAGGNVDALIAHVSPTTDVNDGTIHQLAVRVDKVNASIDCILDGTELMESYSETGTKADFIDWHIDFLLGASNLLRDGTSGVGSVTNPISGKLDEFRIWLDLRTNTEIQNNINSELDAPNGFATDFPNLFRYYKCNDGSGDILTEEIAGDHGALVGNVNDNMWGTDNL